MSPREDGPILSVCSARRKWFWAVWPSWNLYMESVYTIREGGDFEEPCAEGWDATKTEAEEGARRACPVPVPDTPRFRKNETPGFSWASLAHGVLERRAAKKRAAKVSDAKGTEIPEFVWSLSWFSDFSEPGYPETPDHELHTQYERHRVVKKTVRFVYVDRERYHEPRPGSPAQPWVAYHDLRTVRLDRKVLETTGTCHAHADRYEDYFTDAGKEQDIAERVARRYGSTPGKVPAWAQKLGITEADLPITKAVIEEDVETARAGASPGRGGRRRGGLQGASHDLRAGPPLLRLSARPRVPPEGELITEEEVEQGLKPFLNLTREEAEEPVRFLERRTDEFNLQGLVRMNMDAARILAGWPTWRQSPRACAPQCGTVASAAPPPVPRSQRRIAEKTGW